MIFKGEILKLIVGDSVVYSFSQQDFEQKIQFGEIH